MTRQQMLKQMGLTEQEFTDLVTKFKQFYQSLSAGQKKVLKRSLPDIKRAAKSFGPDVTPEELQEICGEDSAIVTFVSNVLENQPNANGDDNGNNQDN